MVVYATRCQCVRQQCPGLACVLLCFINLILGNCIVILNKSGVSRSEFGQKLVGEPNYRRISPDHHGLWISIQLWPGKTRTIIEVDTSSLSLIGSIVCERVLCDKVAPKNKGWERGVENIPLSTSQCFLLAPLLLNSKSLVTWLSQGEEY